MKTCKAPSCLKSVKSVGLCSAHYERYRKSGILDLSPIKHKSLDCSHEKPGVPVKLPNGYQVVCVGQKHVYYHRWLMEQHLKRKLHKWEIVHHIDGNTLNNDLENLEIIENQAKHIHEKHKPINQGTCNISGCERPKKELGLCCGHYKRFYKHGDTFDSIPIGEARKGRMSILKQK